MNSNDIKSQFIEACTNAMLIEDHSIDEYGYQVTTLEDRSRYDVKLFQINEKFIELGHIQNNASRVVRELNSLLREIDLRN